MNKPAKSIGILTLPLHGNYGGLLQLFALKKVLEGLGHNVIHINRWRSTPNYKGIISSILKGRSLKPIIDDYLNPNKNYLLATSTFSDFIEKHITPSSELLRSSRALSNYLIQADFDAVIVGSDQVWRERYTPCIYDYFLDFNLPNTKKISYAASYGLSEYENLQSDPKKVASLLKDFDAVSVREDIALEWCKELGVEDARHVLDPTLLLTKKCYAELLGRAVKPDHRQLVTYILDDSEDCEEAIDRVKCHLSLVSCDLRIQNAENSDPKSGIEHWVGSIMHADFVLIDSFHGLVFSALFNVPFIAVCNASRGSARFTSVCRQLGLEDRLVFDYAEITDELIDQEIDWEAVNQKLSSLRGESIEFIKRALS